MFVDTGTHVVYSAVFGDYDKITAPEQTHENTDYILFTDCTDIESIPKPWRAIHVDWFDTIDIKFFHRRAARHFKALPHMYMPQHVVSVWMDMTHDVIVNPHVIEDKFLSNSDIALFKHEFRDCVFAEGAAVLSFKMAHYPRVMSQLEFYKLARYPLRNGLWETPGMVRRNTNKIAKANTMWWEMMCRFSSRDQISLPFVLDKYNIKPCVLPGMAGKCTNVNNNIIRMIKTHKHGLTSDRHRLTT